MHFTARALLLAATFLLFSSSALASGFFIPEQGAKASSMAGAFTAIADDPSAIFYNVAGIAQQWRLAGIAGATFITFSNSFIGDPNDEFTSGTTGHYDRPVADIHSLFNTFLGQGRQVGPFRFTSSYLTGGVFSFDGFHLTDIGYMFFANEYIRTINEAYDTRIPVASLSMFFANNYQGATTTSGAPLVEGMRWEMSEEAASSILRYATPRPARRLRGVTH